jgi:hypothetical protein
MNKFNNGVAPVAVLVIVAIILIGGGAAYYYYAPKAGPIVQPQQNQYPTNQTASTTPAAQPSITITSPNGGESFAIGSSYPITWNSTGLLPSDVTDIYLGDYTNGINKHATNYVASIAFHIPGDTTSYSDTIPAAFKLTGSKFKISVMIERNGALLVSDESDGYFTIVNP